MFLILIYLGFSFLSGIISWCLLSCFEPVCWRLALPALLSACGMLLCYSSSSYQGCVWDLALVLFYCSFLGEFCFPGLEKVAWLRVGPRLHRTPSAAVSVWCESWQLLPETPSPAPTFLWPSLPHLQCLCPAPLWVSLSFFSEGALCC